MFAVPNDELGQSDQIRDGECPVATSVMRGKQPDEPAKPERERGWIHDEDLLRDELRGSEHDVLVAVRNVA